VYVADYNNNRILRFTSANALLTNASAELVLFGNNSNICTNDSLNSPEQIDYLGNDLYVVDYNNNRVLKLSGVSTTNTTIVNASTTFGHQNSSDCSSSGSLSDFDFPYGVAITNNGTMYVAGGDASTTFCVIKRFDNAHLASDYPAPNSLLGNGTCSGVVSQNTISDNVLFLSVDPVNGHLFVADGGYNRVLLFKQAHLKANLSGADTVFGQPNFTANVGGSCGDAILDFPWGIYYESDSDVIIVTDFNNNRVVFFDNALTTANGPNISAVLGQPLTSSCAPGSANQSTFNSPEAVFYSSDFPGVFLLVADYANNRITRFQCTNNTFSLTETLSNTLNASINASSIAPSSIAASTIAASSVVANSSVVASSVAGSSVAASPASLAASSVAASSVAPSVINTITGSTSASQSNTPSQTGTPSSSRSATRTGTNSKTATSNCGNGIKEPTEQCEGGACCSHRCRFYKANRPCGFRPAGTAKICVRKRRCNGLGVCRPAVIKQNVKRRCKKTDGTKGLCDITTGACV
jgi:hypothetical protein